MKFTPEVVAALAVLRANAENDFERHRINVLERDLTAPPKVEVIDDTHQRFNGVVYCLSSAKKSDHYFRRQALHRDVWAYFNGEIPAGNYEIHHIDWNKTNNDISNLQLVTQSEHGKIHTAHLRNPDIQCATCGKVFHPRQSTQKYCSVKCAKNAITLPRKNCPICGKSFHPKTRTTKFCSKSCASKSSYSKKRKPPNERICPICGEKFYSSYAKVYCSCFCAKKARTQQYKKCPPRKITCGICGKEILGASSTHKYCSECRRKKERQRAREKYQACPLVEKTCPICNEIFTTRAPRKFKYCCPRCADIAKKRKEKERRSRKKVIKSTEAT